ncbi:hypothetical protein KSF_049660 [Reticulibacter mediterranei]|uniref:Pyrrolo-quinoline quinone repeat domain-containing protein n=2 Tax=Reticulibacter mediterranei TaxID=2778369 RepID=A0A8J3IM68_9CHLR|nr:hypothetical protein KSF_049660 [Reticulibacter mediterranei]
MQVADATTAYVQTPKALLAIDVESGQERWHVEAQDTWWIYADAVSNGIVYATVSPGNGGDPSLLALEAANGKQIWKTTIAPLDRGGVQDVEVEGDRVFVRAENNFFVLQARDGKVLWSSYATSPIRAGGVVFLTRWRKTGDSIIDAVQEKDGKLLWSFHPPTVDGEPQHAITAGPEDPLVHSIITSDGILGVESQGILYGVNTKNGSLLWNVAKKDIDYHPGSLFTANGIIYAQSMDDTLLAIEAKSGTIPWSVHVDGGMGGVTLDSTGGILFVTVSSGLGPEYVEAVRANGKVLWKMQLQQTVGSPYWSYYQIADGRIYQVVARAVTDIKGSDIPLTYYKQMNLSATKIGDRTALWSKLISV